MIRAINDDTIRIGPASELRDFIGWYGDGKFYGRYKLPLFSTCPTLISADDVEENMLCFVIRRTTYEYYIDNNVNGLPLDIVDLINKTWNKFYEENTR